MRRRVVAGLVIVLVVSLIASLIVAVARVTKIEIGDNFSNDVSVSVEVRDNDPSQGEGYLNENLAVVFYTTKSVSEVGDPNHGLTVEVSSLTHGWGPFVADVKGQTNYGQGHIEENGYWTVSVAQNAYIRWRLHVPVDSTGHLGQSTPAYFFLWADTDNNEANGYGTAHKPTTTLWDKGDRVKVTVTSYGKFVLISPEEETIQGTNLIQ